MLFEAAFKAFSWRLGLEPNTLVNVFVILALIDLQVISATWAFFTRRGDMAASAAVTWALFGLVHRSCFVFASAFVITLTVSAFAAQVSHLTTSMDWPQRWPPSCLSCGLQRGFTGTTTTATPLLMPGSLRIRRGPLSYEMIDT